MKKDDSKFLSWTAAVLVVGMVGTLGYLAMQEEETTEDRGPGRLTGDGRPGTEGSTEDGRPETGPVPSPRSSVSTPPTPSTVGAVEAPVEADQPQAEPVDSAPSAMPHAPCFVEVTYEWRMGVPTVVMPLADLESQIRSWRNCG